MLAAVQIDSIRQLLLVLRSALLAVLVPGSHRLLALDGLVPSLIKSSLIIRRLLSRCLPRRCKAVMTVDDGTCPTRAC